MRLRSLESAGASPFETLCRTAVTFDFGHLKIQFARFAEPFALQATPQSLEIKKPTRVCSRLPGQPRATI